jgi:hypothetical protein
MLFSLMIICVWFSDGLVKYKGNKNHY